VSPPLFLLLLFFEHHSPLACSSSFSRSDFFANSFFCGGVVSGPAFYLQRGSSASLSTRRVPLLFSLFPPSRAILVLSFLTFFKSFICDRPSLVDFKWKASSPSHSRSFPPSGSISSPFFSVLPLSSLPGLKDFLVCRWVGGIFYFFSRSQWRPFPGFPFPLSRSSGPA